MRRFDLLYHSWIPSLLLLLVFFLPPQLQTVNAQEQISTSEDLLTSLRSVEAPSDQQLIDLAETLLKARADTEISFATYRKGVHYFRQNHPQFYGAFFGDPFYASDNVRFDRLVRKRQSVNLKVNPRNSFWRST